VNALAATHVLVADDDPLVRGFIRDVLTLEGHVVLEAENGKRALAILREHPEVRLIVTDVLMPGLDGVEFIRAVRGASSQELPKILAISGGGSYGQGLYLDNAQSFGADVVLPKPFSDQTLLKAIQSLGFARADG